MGLTACDLFCGAGGLAEGFRLAGYSIRAGLDSDPDACATFQHNFPKAATIHGDITQPVIREELLEAAAGADVLVGGPPCQAFSQVRNHSRLIDDPRNSLYREFVHAISAVRPLGFLMENVTGMDQMGVRAQVLADLALGGEYLVRAQVVNAADFGVPQTRRRILFIGIRTDLNEEPPMLSGSGAAGRLSVSRHNGSSPPHYSLASLPEEYARLSHLLADPDRLEVVSARQAISDLEHLQRGSRQDELDSSALPQPSSAYQRLMRSDVQRVRNVSVPRMTEDTALRLDGIPPGGNYLDLDERLLDRYLTGKRWGPDNGSGRLGRRHYYAYRRLHPDIWSWTLNTKADSVYHYASCRALSVREFARIQSFSDAFEVITDTRRGNLPGRIAGGAAHSRYRQVGNAVPPLLAKAAAEALALSLTRAHRRLKRAS